MQIKESRRRLELPGITLTASVLYYLRSKSSATSTRRLTKKNTKHAKPSALARTLSSLTVRPGFLSPFTTVLLLTPTTNL